MNVMFTLDLDDYGRETDDSNPFVYKDRIYEITFNKNNKEYPVCGECYTSSLNMKKKKFCMTSKEFKRLHKEGILKIVG